MEKMLTILIVLMIFMVGCSNSQNDSLTSSDSNQAAQQHDNAASTNSQSSTTEENDTDTHFEAEDSTESSETSMTQDNIGDSKDIDGESGANDNDSVSFAGVGEWVNVDNSEDTLTITQVDGVLTVENQYGQWSELGSVLSLTEDKASFSSYTLYTVISVSGDTLTTEVTRTQAPGPNVSQSTYIVTYTRVAD